MRIKVQMLLPKRAAEEEEEDPREELVRNLIEYRKFKKAADHLEGKGSCRRNVFVRPVPKYIEEKDSIPKMELSLFDLMDAFKSILKDLRKDITYRVEIESHSVDEKIDFIKEEINRNSEILFTELINKADSRLEIIATFLAILELIRGGIIIARQMTDCNDIWIYKREYSKVVEGQDYGE